MFRDHLLVWCSIYDEYQNFFRHIKWNLTCIGATSKHICGKQGRE